MIWNLEVDQILEDILVKRKMNMNVLANAVLMNNVKDFYFAQAIFLLRHKNLIVFSSGILVQALHFWPRLSLLSKVLQVAKLFLGGGGLYVCNYSLNLCDAKMENGIVKKKIRENEIRGNEIRTSKICENEIRENEICENESCRDRIPLKYWNVLSQA